jgi:hypothetical protein
LVRRARSAAAAAPAAVLTIIDQMLVLVLWSYSATISTGPLPAVLFCTTSGRGPHSAPATSRQTVLGRLSNRGSATVASRIHAVMSPVPASYVARTAGKTKRKDNSLN